MAGMKQLSAGSSQILMMMFRDKNNAPIKADSVHVKGSIFTGSGKPFEFEVNKGGKSEYRPIQQKYNFVVGLSDEQQPNNSTDIAARIG